MMRGVLGGWALVCVVAGSPAHAQGTIDPGPLLLPAGWTNPAATTDQAALAALPFEPEAYRGAEQLGLNPAYVHDVRVGLQKLYLRDYQGTRDHFQAVETRFPGTGVGAFADAVIWQALMLENDNLRYEDQYWVSSKRARKELDAAIQKPGAEGWEHFLFASVVGIEAIHSVREASYLPAVTLAVEAMDHLAQASKHAPDFVDLQLVDGMHHYWRTVITNENRMLPVYGEHRAEGIEEMKRVRDRGVFLSAPAQLALAYSYREQRSFKSAKSALLANQRKYPDNVINNMLLGQVYIELQDYAAALATFDRIRRASPSNVPVRYWRGIALMRSGRHVQAIPELEAYLASGHIDDSQASYARYRLGQCFHRSQRYADAQRQYELAIELDPGNTTVASALDRLLRARDEGRIDY